MSELSQFIGEDSRTPIQRLRRFQLHKIADSFNLQYPPGAGKDVMIKLFEANDIDVTQSPDVQWQVFNGRDVDGNLRQELYPVEQQSASMRNGVNASAALDARVSAKDKEEMEFEKARFDVLERENAQLRTTNEQLKGILEERLAALEGKGQKPKDSTPYWAAYHKAQAMKLPVQRGMKLSQIQAMIDKAESESVDG